MSYQRSMDDLHILKDTGYGRAIGKGRERDTVTQLILSLILGFFAFLTFCILRPKWSSLYAARKKKRQSFETAPLPDLPNTFFGWIPVLYKVTEQQVLASAGLDAYVFLRFFRMATKFLLVTLFFGLVVIKPVHDAYPRKSPPNKDKDTASFWFQSGSIHPGHDFQVQKENHNDLLPTNFLWMYLVFAYLYSGLAIYLLKTETERIIDVRQEYLGHQSTITDRTIRLSGIPQSLRSEVKIKEFIEELQIGKVESVTICREWQELDDQMDHRKHLLRKLEESWTDYLKKKRIQRNLETLPISQVSSPDLHVDHNQGEETDHLIQTENGHTTSKQDDRPKIRLRYGFLKLKSKKIDAIDYYEEKLGQADEQIKILREKEFRPMPLAFVTMDSVPSCQMAIQAVLDPSPMQLIAKASPAPTDIIWRNTYMPRKQRMLRGWIITLIIALLTIFWSVLLVPIATIINEKSISKVWPELGEALKSHSFASSLLKTQLPTLLSALLFLAVPFFYDWLANLQGMTSQSDVELSVISKNFFFLFFNYFVVFTILGTFSNFYEFLDNFRDSLKDTTKVAFTLAQSLQEMLLFYANLIILQGVALFPFRLLEFGSVALYPISRIGAKTPRDFEELVQPPVFSLGFFLPQVLLIFIICMVYSVLRGSWILLLAGLFYFLVGHGVYKYQLLYAMDHKQHSSGRTWILISRRVLIGLVISEITIAGQLALNQAWTRAGLVLPIILFTIWFIYYFDRNYTPLMKFISLKSIERTRSQNEESLIDPDEWDDEATLRQSFEIRRRATVDESRERGLRFVNPSLDEPLEDVWISSKPVRDEDIVGRNLEQRSAARLESYLNAAT